MKMLSTIHNIFYRENTHIYPYTHIKKILLITLLAIPLLSCAPPILTDFDKPAVAASKDFDKRSVKITDDNTSGRNIVKKPKEALVVLDPGHGGEDSGTGYGSMNEKDINLDISLRLGKLLEDSGIKVVYTRKKDVAVELIERAAIANNLGADLFISVHNNQMPEDASYKGTETLYCPPPKQASNNMDGEKLAKIVQKELVKALNTVNNGIIDRPNLAVLHRTKMPAIIAEVAYISNRTDRANLGSSQFRQKAAGALSSAVLKALNEMGAFKGNDGKLMLPG